MDDDQKLSDTYLVAWAIKHGWKYHYVNDQLEDTNGAMTTTNKWLNIGSARREQILGQMNQSAKRADVPVRPAER